VIVLPYLKFQITGDFSTNYGGLSQVSAVVSTMSLLHSSLHVRLQYLASISESSSTDDIASLMVELIAAKYDEKPFRTALQTTLNQLVDRYFNTNKSMGGVVESVVGEWEYLSSSSKGLLILSLLEYAATEKYLEESTEDDSGLIRRLTMGVMEYVYFTDQNKQTLSVALSRVSRILKHSPRLAASLFDPSAVSSTSPAQLVILSMLTREARSSDTSYRAALFAEISKKLILSKSPLSPATLEGLSSFLSSVTQEEWTEHIETTLSKMIKKSPESASCIVSSGTVNH
jgi:hypothetical protein